MEKWIIPRLSQWIGGKTNNLIERFNRYLKETLFRGQTYSNAATVVDILSRYFSILETVLVPPPKEEEHTNEIVFEEQLLFSEEVDRKDTTKHLLEKNLSISLERKVFSLFFIFE